MHHRRLTVLALAATTVVGGALVAAPTATAAPAGPVVVTRGLNNPRGLSLLPDGSVLLVAEAGKGGPSCSSGGPDGDVCIGTTGSVDSVVSPNTARRTAPNRVITGLISGAGPDGSGAVGPDGVSANTLSRINTVMTYAPPDVIPSGLPGDQAGKLLRNPAYRPGTVFADITGYEMAHDPDGQGVDSNPYGVLALPTKTLVADAAANDILSVAQDGTVSLFAVLPNIQTGKCAGVPNDNGTTGCDFVPTSLAEGPDGSIYVGGLGGETPGAGRVLKLDRVTGAVMRTWSGLTAVSGLAVGPDGSIYASQLSFDPSAGKLTRITPLTNARADVSVPFPGGVAVDPKTGSIFVAAFSIAPDTGLGIPGMDSSGQIWRVSFAAPTV